MRVDTNDYSVDPHAVGRLVDVHADLEHVRVSADGRIVATLHLAWARHTAVTDHAYLGTARHLRHRFQHPQGSAGADLSLARDLADYDRVFGLTSEARLSPRPRRANAKAAHLSRHRIEGAPDRRGLRPARRPGA